MYQIDPRNHFIHEPFDGENLERADGDCSFPFTPLESALIVLVTLAAIAGIIWRMT